MPYKSAKKGKNRSVIYETDEPRVIYKNGTPAWRNNKPGNLRSTNFSKKHGSIGEAGGFAVFPDYTTGREAVKALLKTETYQSRTIGEAINRYVPSDENDTEQYLKNIESMAGMAAKEKMSSLSEEQLENVVSAIEKIEGYVKGEIMPLPPTKTKQINSKDTKLQKPSRGLDFGLDFSDPIYKQNDQITEGELLDLQKRAYNTPSSSSDGQELEDKISKIYDLHYSGSVKKDATGRMVQPKASLGFPKESSAAKTKDGADLLESFTDIASRIDSSEDKISTTKTLQKALNQTVSHVGLRPLKEDGVFGEKTATALTKSLSNLGSNVYKKLFA